MLNALAERHRFARATSSPAHRPMERCPGGLHGRDDGHRRGAGGKRCCNGTGFGIEALRARAGVGAISSSFVARPSSTRRRASGDRPRPCTPCRARRRTGQATAGQFDGMLLQAPCARLGMRSPSLARSPRATCRLLHGIICSVHTAAASSMREGASATSRCSIEPRSEAGASTGCASGEAPRRGGRGTPISDCGRPGCSEPDPVRRLAANSNDRPAPAAQIEGIA